MFTASPLHTIGRRTRSRRRGLPARRLRLHAEPLENRLVLATVTWIGGSGDWNSGMNWSNGNGPGANDDAVIDVAGISVTHSSGAHAVQSLTINDAFTLSGGTLTVAGELLQENASPLTMTGGTLRGATVVGEGGAVLLASGGTLDGVTLGDSAGGVATVQGSGAPFFVTNSLTFANGSLVDLANGMILIGNQTLGGDGEIRLRPGSGISSFNETTFGAGLTIDRAGAGRADINAASGRITNQATIRADAGSEIRVTGNPGASFTNSAGGVLAADGGTLSLLASWSNAGRIEVNNSTLNLGGRVTTDGIGTIARTGGTVNLTGVLENTGRTLALDAATGSWNLAAAGTLRGGSLVTTGGAVLVAGTAASQGGTLDGVKLGDTAGGAATVQGNGGVFFVSGGLTFANGSLVDLANGMILAGDQTLGGDGEIRLRSGGGISNFNKTTFGPGLTIHRANAGRSDINMVSGSITNLGTIRADAGGEVRVTGNPGIPLTNAAGGVLAADGGTLSLLASWSNAGRIEVNNSTLNLGGSFTTDGIGTLARSGGTVNLTGLLDNTGRALVLDEITGSWNLASGAPELRGGTLATIHGAALVVTHDSGKLSGVTLGGTVGGLPVSADVQAITGFTVTGGLTFANGSLLDLATGVLLVGDQTLGGDGEIRFLGGAVGIRNFDRTTIGPGLTIHDSAASTGSIFLVGGSITNLGTIRADEGGLLRVFGNSGTTFTNAAGGVLTAAGGTIIVENTTNVSAGTLTGGTWQALGNGAIRFTGADITKNAAEVALDGVGAAITRDAAGTSALANLATNAAAGRLALRNGAHFSTAGAFTNDGTVTLGSASTLTVGGAYHTAGGTTVDGSLVAGTVTVDQSGTLAGSGTVSGNVVNDGLVSPGTSAGVLSVDGSYTQGGTGQLEVEIGGTSAGSQYDRLRVSDWATLNGTLGVHLVDGFGPVAGQQFEIMTFAGQSGAFSAVTGLSQGRFPLFDLAVNAADVELSALANGTDLAFDSFATASFPSNATPGENVAVTYTVRNLSEPPAEGHWIDSVYLSRDGILDPGDTLLARVDHAGVAGLGSYTETAAAPLPALIDGGYRVIVVADSRGLVSDANRRNNTGVSAQAVSVTVPSLELGTPVSGSIAAGQDLYYRVLIAPGDEIAVAADFAALPGAEVSVRYAFLPDEANRDDAAPAGQLHGRLVLSNTRGGTYYVRLHGRDDAAAAVGFTLSAAASGFEIVSVSPSRGSNRGVPAQITLQGTQFTDQTQVELRQAGALIRPAQAVVFQSANKLVATIDLAGLPVGNYQVVAKDAGQTAVAFDEFVVTDSDPGQTGAWITAIAFVRVGAVIRLTLYDHNSSETPLPAPVIQIRATDVGRDGGEETTGTLTIGDSLPGFLPGLWFQKLDPFKLYGTSPTLPGTSTFQLSILEPSDTPMNWDGQKATLRPETIPADVWDAIWGNLRPQLGETLSDYLAFLETTVEKLRDAGGGLVEDIDRLFRFELEQANNMPGVPLPTTAVDVAFPAPGLPLVFGRAHAESLTGRSHLGRLGRGWTDGFDISAAEDAATGRVTVRRGADARSFGRRPDGSYEAVPGDFGVLSRVDGTFRLREATGEVTAFRADGLLDYVQDANGNRITAGYTGSQLTSLTHSSGAALTLAYNGQGRLREVAGPAGGVATYEYDPSGEHLVRVTTTAGTTEYTYSADATGPRAHALTSIASPDGTHLYFDYDSQGRLARQQGDDGAETRRFGYDSASIRVTDARDQVTTYSYDDSFRIRQVRDPLGRVAYRDYDAAGNPVLIGTAGGGESTLSYDARGNATVANDPLGESQVFTYEPVRGGLATWHDALGHEVRFGNDASGNRVTTTYVDGTIQRYGYGAQGNVETTENRLGQRIQFTYNSSGQVTRKLLPDGSHVDYTYTARGNLETAVDASGTTRLEYLDANPDLITRITYPNGRSLAYTYENGRRTRMVDQSGFTVDYHYDAAGRLDEVHEGAGAGSGFVHYDYDPDGRLARETRGNGTTTDYAYDGAGQLLEITHRAPDASIQSKFVYTYDPLGRRTSVTTLEGRTDYGYDGANRLTSVTLPGGRVLTYAYDAAGNRTEVSDHGATTTYTVNDLNEYLAFGSTTQQFDAAGNLRTSSSAVGSTSYGYDAEGRLVSQVTPAGTWTYEYDALGNRIAETHNGVRTEYVIDPFGLGNVVGEYDGAGNLEAHYVQGLGLASRVDGAGAAYYQFDAVGNTSQLTGAGGVVLNAYRYLPSGESLAASEAVANPFEYVGRFGVLRDGSGLDSMRNRWYDPVQGRFTQPDPTGLLGGSNLYAYAGNDPVSRIDPSGLSTNYGFTFAAGGALTFGLIQNDDGTVVPYVGFGGGIGAGFSLTHSPSDAGDNQLSWGLQFGGGYAAGGYDYDGQSITPNYGVGGFEVGGALTLNLTLGKYDLSGLLEPFGIHSPAVPSGTVQQTLSVQRLSGARDPNDIVGMAGLGAAGFVVPQPPLPYVIHFQNLPTAEAPAAEVVVTHVLDADLDLNTFALEELGFGDLTVAVPAGRQSYSTRLDLRSTLGLFVDVTAGLDRSTRTVTWRFEAIDPETLDLPVSPFVGFLPPDRLAPEGEGFVSFSVQPKADLATGTRIDASATIVFDTNDPMDTNVWVNTIDAGPPTSSVTAMPAITATPSFSVSWSGIDEGGVGSGIAGYDIYVSVDGGPFALWLEGMTSSGTATYDGANGHTYGFLSVAIDQVGHREATPTEAQATTTVQTRQATTLSAVAGAGVYGGTATLLATLTSGTTGLAGEVVTFSLQVGATTIVRTATTDAGGVATLSGSDLAGLDAGTYVGLVGARFDGDTAYLGSDATGTLVIARATASLSLGGLAATYDGSPHAATVATVPTGLDGVTLTYAGSMTPPTAAGSYSVVASLQNANYQASEATGTLVIARATPAITWADPAAIVYGTPLSGMQLNASSSIAGTFSYSIVAGTVLHAGPAQVLSVVFSPADAVDYSAVMKTVLIDVSQAPLSVTAEDTSKRYGQPNPAFTARLGGFVNGDTSSSLGGTLGFTTTAATQSHVGSYPITPGGLTAYDYSITYVAGMLAVTPAALTISADNLSKLYGAAVPPLTLGYAGLVNGDTPATLGQAPNRPPTAMTATTAVSPVGAYAIAVAGASDADYVIAYVGGTLTVTPAMLTVTADDKRRLRGAPNPALTYTIAGFVNGETAATGGVTGGPVLSTTANTTSPPGAYVIAIARGTLAASDYTFALVAGTLTVIADRPPVATVTLDSATPQKHDVLAATATKLDPDGDAVSLTFVWKVNGVQVRTFASAVAVADSLDLKAAGKFKKGDVVTVEVTPSDGMIAGTTVRATATVSNGAGKALLVLGPPLGGRGKPPVLTDAMLQPIVAEAESRWRAAGLDAASAARLRRLDVRVADLPPGYLGVAAAAVLYVDRDAAGYGWFVDATPSNDAEFPPALGSPARGHADLLSVVLHEMGHELGLDHDAGDDLMNERLPLGVRRVPVPLDMVHLHADPLDFKPTITMPAGRHGVERRGQQAITRGQPTPPLSRGMVDHLLAEWGRVSLAERPAKAGQRSSSLSTLHRIPQPGEHR